MTDSTKLPEEIDTEYTPILTALPDGWNAITYNEYGARKLAQHEDKENLRAVQIVSLQNKIAEQQALLDEAKKRAEQAEADALYLLQHANGYNIPIVDYDKLNGIAQKYGGAQ